MANKRPVIGFIGLGTMGKAMAENLINAGYVLNLFNRSQTNLLALKSLGGIPCASPEEVAKASDIVLLSLPDSKAVEAVVYGETGLIHGLKSGAVLIDTSSSQPESTRKIARDLGLKGIAMLDAPVSGGPRGAQEGSLSIMVGGQEADFDSCRPILEILGKNLFYVGPSGSGHTLKVVNNLLYGTLFVASCEAISLGVKAGIDPETLIDVISRSSGSNHAVKVKFKEKVLNRDFAPGFTLSLLEKDMALAMELARALDVTLNTTKDAFKVVHEGLSTSVASLDHSALIQEFEKTLGITIKATSSKNE